MQLFTRSPQPVGWGWKLNGKVEEFMDWNKYNKEKKEKKKWKDKAQ